MFVRTKNQQPPSTGARSSLRPPDIWACFTPTVPSSRSCPLRGTGLSRPAPPLPPPSMTGLSGCYFFLYKSSHYNQQCAANLAYHISGAHTEPATALAEGPKGSSIRAPFLHRISGCQTPCWRQGRGFVPKGGRGGPTATQGKGEHTEQG